MPPPLYDVLLILHVATALIGFGSIAVGGLYARRGAASPAPSGEDRLVRFFAPGVDWPARLIFVVPALGLAMLLGGDRPAVGHLWPWLGLAIWFLAAGVATARTWPAEKRAQRALSDLAAGEADGLARFRLACRQMEGAAAVVAVCFVAVVALMIVQP